MDLEVVFLLLERAAFQLRPCNEKGAAFSSSLSLEFWPHVRICRSFHQGGLDARKESCVERWLPGAELGPKQLFDASMCPTTDQSKP